MELEKAKQAKKILDEIMKLEIEYNMFNDNPKIFHIGFYNKIPNENGSYFNYNFSHTFHEVEITDIINFIKKIMLDKVDILKKQLEKL